MASLEESPLPMLLGHLGKSEPEKIQQEPFLNQVRLFYASAAGDPVNVKSLLEEKADVNYKDHNARTALHSVCGCKSAGAKETARLLLRHKANVNAIDNAGMSPMDIAVKVQNLSIQRLLEDRGVELQASLEQKGRESAWLLKASELKLRKQLGTTLKSTVHLADWHGTEVVVKSVKMERRRMLTHVSKSASLCKSLGVDAEQPEQIFEEHLEDEEDEDIKRACEEELLREIELVASFRHPDLVLFLGACLDPGQPVMFVTEYMPKGDVERYMAQMRDKKQVAYYCPPLSQTVGWCCAIARALAFLHKFPVLHRDLKPMNLLLTSTLDVKVSDFGTGRLVSKTSAAVTEVTSALTMGTVGTFSYTAPEMMRSPHYNEKVDIYAFALIMYFLSSGKTPFYYIHPQERMCTTTAASLDSYSVVTQESKEEEIFAS
ncbi:Integrin-linked protein kinase 1 (Ankyrin protein kinase 1) [Durusdinium trenchii]|uniref:Integrin-linked protein kinase 1 (Ankyrin protein kinase 1) n=1 Tax=Durusdinium trenchii TaxID=1381693 RepID=A0ABP0JAY8_9DINO